MKVAIPVSVGELIDKITILQIKNENTNSEYVKKELDELIKIATINNVYDLESIKELYNVNKTLWRIEDRLREKENLKEFDEEFIELARSVYITNDERARIKRKINEVTNSEYKEIKIFSVK